jgi:DNA-binding NarL/FixJ family response regulator
VQSRPVVAAVTLAFAGHRLRRRQPDIGILVLSQLYEEQYALALIGERADGAGYLLKEGVGDVEEFIGAVERVAAGGTALDPEVVGRMLGRRGAEGPVGALTPRERDVLGVMAEGKSNQGIAESLFVTEAAVQKHITSIFHKLALGPTPTGHRRVLAVLAYLREHDREGASLIRHSWRRSGSGMRTRARRGRDGDRPGDLAGLHGADRRARAAADSSGLLESEIGHDVPIFINNQLAGTEQLRDFNRRANPPVFHEQLHRRSARGVPE